MIAAMVGTFACIIVLACVPGNKEIKSNLFFHMGGLTLRIFLRSKWLLDLLNLEIFKVFLTFSMGKNNFLPKYLLSLNKH